MPLGDVDALFEARDQRVQRQRVLHDANVRRVIAHALDRRAMADGLVSTSAIIPASWWFPQFNPAEQAAKNTMERLRAYIRDAGRRVEEVGIEGRVNCFEGTPEDWAQTLEDWREIGATHIGVNTMGMGLASPRDHIEAIRRFKETTPQYA